MKLTTAFVVGYDPCVRYPQFMTFLSFDFGVILEITSTSGFCTILVHRTHPRTNYYGIVLCLVFSSLFFTVVNPPGFSLASTNGMTFHHSTVHSMPPIAYTTINQFLNDDANSFFYTELRQFIYHDVTILMITHHRSKQAHVLPSHIRSSSLLSTS